VQVSTFQIFHILAKSSFFLGALLKCAILGAQRISLTHNSFKILLHHFKCLNSWIAHTLSASFPFVGGRFSGSDVSEWRKTKIETKTAYPSYLQPVSLQLAQPAAQLLAASGVALFREVRGLVRRSGSKFEALITAIVRLKPHTTDSHLLFVGQMLQHSWLGGERCAQLIKAVGQNAMRVCGSVMATTHKAIE
jgi:hypothetical protein